MNKLVYQVLRHDGGWAYEANGTFSETFRTRDQARRAARLAASEQSLPGQAVPIDYEDDKGKWHHEIADGDDRPEAIVKG